MEDENGEVKPSGNTSQRKRAKIKQNKENKKMFGKLNLMKYFIYEVNLT